MKQTAVITSRQINTPDTITLGFLVDGRPLEHRAGQYITVYFDDTGVPEGKAYSLSSRPGADESTITVKKVGLFSGKLHDLKIGDEMTISHPYGSFNAFNDEPIVAIAAGTGISPIWSVIQDENQRATGRPIRLLYSNRTPGDIVFHKELEVLAGENSDFIIEHFITRAANVDGVSHRRIDAERDAAIYKDTHCFYICGSADFVRSMWQQLSAAGVLSDRITTETFFGAP